MLDSYEREVRTSGLIDHLLHRAHEHKTTMGQAHSLGNIGYTEGMYLYAVLRKLRPRVAVETGVANGFSSAFSLLALKATARVSCTRSTCRARSASSTSREVLRRRGPRRHSRRARNRAG